MLGQEKKNILWHNLFVCIYFEIVLNDLLSANHLKLSQNGYKLQKRFHVLEVDIITITKKHWFGVSSSKDASSTGRVLNERLCTCLSHKSLSYLWVASILRHPVQESICIKNGSSRKRKKREKKIMISLLVYVCTFFLSFFLFQYRILKISGSKWICVETLILTLFFDQSVYKPPCSLIFSSRYKLQTNRC